MSQFILSRRAVLILGTSLAASTLASGRARADDTVWVGVSGPLTGPAAQYGAQWKKGFDLALDVINGPDQAKGGGGIAGKKLAYDFEDSQNDPRQAVAIAQKFVADPRIVAELGDFSSTTSMAASPIYQRGKLVQLGFTNSHPKFTLGGDYMWSPGLSQAEEQPALAALAITQVGMKKPAVLHLNTDWGKASKDLFVAAATKLGAQIVTTEGYLPDERDFRSTLTRIKEANPDGLVLESYYSDGALIVRQAREAGITLPIAAVGSVYSPKFIELGGDAVEGVYTESQFFPDDTRPEVQAFVKAFKAKYNEDPDAFNVFAYDALILAAAVMRQYGTDRASFREGIEKIKDVPNVIFGKLTFDPNTRRASGATATNLVVHGGKFTLYQKAA
jgi:branched-chain amino acid transport system substrate-binding protein